METLLNLLIFYHLLCLSDALNVALHAQVDPFGDDKVVGSVITTDGLLAALKKRYDIDHAAIFYPFIFKYLVMNDLIFIEGWFPSLNTFIQMTRTNFPNVRIIFYCLDPEYPGLEYLEEFNVDGFMTNSYGVTKIS